jgi:hypothetical protein
LLQKIGGVYSCKDLCPEDVSEILKAIREAAPKGNGWKSRQIRKYRQYCKFAGMVNNEGLTFLCEITGIFHEDSPYLKQGHFDKAMAAIEAELEKRITQGQVKAPEKVNIRYWRGRKPSRGKVNTRESHLIRDLWMRLSGYLPEDKRSESYLYSLAAKACHRVLNSLDDLSSLDSLKVIEALKNRLKSEENKLAKEVPF